MADNIDTRPTDADLAVDPLAVLGEVLARPGPWESARDPAIASLARRIIASLARLLLAEQHAHLGLRRAHALLNAGFESCCDDRDRLKQTCRTLEAEVARLQALLDSFAARIHAQSEILSARAEIRPYLCGNCGQLAGEEVSRG